MCVVRLQRQGYGGLPLSDPTGLQHQSHCDLLTMIRTKYKPARLVFEMAEDVIFPGYVTGRQWNGFEDAYFKPEVWQRVIDWFNRDDPDPEHIEALQAQEPNEDGLYSLGMGYVIYQAEDQ